MKDSVQVLHDSSGAPKLLRGVMWDITPYRQAVEALGESQNQYQHLVDQASEIICRTDSSGHFTFFNAAAPRLLRRPPEELVGQHFLELVRPDYRAVAKRFYWRQFLRMTRSSYFEFPALTGDGGYVWLGQNVQLVTEGGKVVGFQAIARDLTDHKRAEARLIDSEERYRIVAETATDAILTIDAQGYIVFANPSATTIFGYSTEEILGARLALLLPDHPLSVPQRMARINLETGRAYFGGQALELAGRHKNGRELPLEVSLGEFTQGGRHLFTAVIRDVTERKRAEEEIRRSDRRFRSLIENASDITLIVNEEGRILYTSPSLQRILGYTPEELTGQSYDRDVHPEDRDTLAAALRRGLSGSRVAGGAAVCRVRHRDGSWRVLEAVAQDLLEDPAVRGIVVNLRDVTERQRVQAELREANETVRTLVEASPLAIVAMDREGRVTKWNPAAERMFGWPEHDVLGKDFPFVPDEWQEDALTLRRMVLSGDTVTVERVRRTRGGSSILVNVSASPLRDAGGAITGAVAMITDITQRKRLEDQLRQAQKMEAVGQLAGGIAHDFNNLLTVITGYSQLVMNALPEGERGRIHSQEILHAAEQASALTRQLLAFSRRQVAQPQPMDLNAAVTRMLQMLRRLIGENIELVTALRPLSFPVSADPGQIEQVILNLVVNARDAMPGGGCLTIETCEVELDAAYASTHVSVKPGRHVMLAVSDTGHGIDAETRGRVFEPFFTTKEVGKGTGLGLSTVYGIVKQNRGNIWVYSEPGIGSTFKVYFPLGAAPAQLEDAADANRVPRGTETVLLVEDEGGLRQLVKELLEQLGYLVLAAGSYAQAAAVCHQHHGFIHLLLTDVVMPEVNGKETAERLCRFRPHMRVLYMSGYPDETMAQHGILGAEVAFLQKPFSQEALAVKIREVLDAPFRSLAANV
jgi:PAS domain S-box-containing protein